MTIGAKSGNTEAVAANESATGARGRRYRSWHPAARGILAPMFNVREKTNIQNTAGIRSQRCATGGWDEGRRCSGFTLIELLAVIALIAILAALLFPAIGSSLRKAKEAACGSNMRQLGAAFVMFASDNGGALPAGQGSGLTWPVKIGPYIGGAASTNNILKIMRCPAHNGPAVFKGWAVGSYAALVSNATTLSDPYGAAFSQRVFLGWFGMGLGPEVDLRPLSMIPAPNNTAMLTELAHNRNNQAGYGNVLNNINPFQIDPTSTGVQTGWADANNMTLLLHNGRVNYLFADGHISAFDYNSSIIYGTGTLAAPLGIWSVYPRD